MSLINHEAVLTIVDELNEYTDYVPLVLHRYVKVDYFDRVSDEVAQEYYKNRTQLQREVDFNKFLEKDLDKWLKKNPQYKFIKSEDWKK